MNRSAKAGVRRRIQARPRLRQHPVPQVAATRRKRRKMSSSTTDARQSYSAAVITVSDSCSRGEHKDASGPAVADLLRKAHFEPITSQIVPDDAIQIQNALIRLAREVNLIVTTGGTGIAPRDVTPEATQAACER